MNIYFSPLAEEKLIKLTKYLTENWSIKIKDEFLEKLKSKLLQISTHPETCPKSSFQNNLFKSIVTKQNTLYYRWLRDKAEIEIITIFDTRQHPNTLKRDLK
ncbi:MAG: type II toxin-antitoxin system RelE/ParE family toxin [Aquaticitalea sp.]